MITLFSRPFFTLRSQMNFLCHGGKELLVSDSFLKVFLLKIFLIFLMLLPTKGCFVALVRKIYEHV